MTSAADLGVRAARGMAASIARPRILVTAGLVALAGCKQDALPLGPSTTSPQAAAEPAPLEPIPSRGDETREARRGAAVGGDAGAEPVLGEGVQLEYDVQLGETSFAARMGDTPAPLLDVLRKRASTSLLVVASGTRVAFSVRGPRFLFPSGLELRAHGERAGYALVDPAERRYTEVPEGLWRALLTEGRTDVAPLRPVDAPDVNTRSAGSATPVGARRQVSLASKSATLTLTLVTGQEPARWSPTLVQAFAEIAGLAPSLEWIDGDEWPESADIRWANGRSLRLFAAARTPRSVEADELLAAPSGFARNRPRIAPPSSRAILGPQDLAQLRGAPPEGPATEGSTLWLVNRDVTPRIALLEGVPVGWVAGNQSLALEGLRPGRYAVRWISPLGELDSGDGVANAPGVVTLQGP